MFPIRILGGLVLLAAGTALAQPCLDLQTFAGRSLGDGGAAAAAVLRAPRDVTLDAAGNILIADAGNARVRKIDAASGVITTIAGNGAPGIPTDGQPAVQVTMKEPSGVAAFGSDVYIADLGESVNTVWRVTPDGIIHRFAGSGIGTGSKDGPGGDPADDLNDGQLAVFATLTTPARVVVDTAGNVYIADFGNNRVRKVDAASGRISTIADGLNAPVGLALGQGTDLFIADTGTNRILKTSTTGGTPTVFAGNGSVGLANDVDSPMPAMLAPLNGASEIAVDANGVVYIGDTKNNVIHKVTTDGIMHRVAGSGLAGVEDAPTPGFLAHFRSPGVALGTGQTILIPDIDNNRIRRYDLAADAVTTVSGGDNSPGDGGPATSALLDRPTGLALDAGNAVFIAEHDSHRVRRVDTAGTISTVVNAAGQNDSAADGTPAVNSPLRQPTGVAFDAAGHLLVSDAVDHRVLIVDSGGVIRTFAGTAKTPGFSGDGGPATSALLNTPLRMARAQDGSIYIADFNNNRIRKIDPTGIISTVAGNGGELNQPAGLTFDASGNLYIADFGSNRVLRLDTTGSLSPLVGSGTAGALGDNGQAISAQLNGPTDVAIGTDGGLFIVDQLNNKVRYVAPDPGGGLSGTSRISTVLGDGTPGFVDAPGVQSRLLFPTGIVIDAQSRVLIADRGNQLVRVGTPAQNCNAPTSHCDTSDQCDDGNPCTIDTCEANHMCSSTPLAPQDCHPSCAANGGACMLGGGPRNVDCLAETFVVGRQGGPPAVFRCHDNDPACDFDPTPGTCTFRMACCLNEPGCSASNVARVSVQGKAAAVLLSALGKLGASSRAGSSVIYQSPVQSPDTCTELTSVSVPMRKQGRRPGKLVVKSVATGTVRRQRDADAIKLICVP